MSFNLPFYTIRRNVADAPFDYYKNHLQALINAQWTNTTTGYTVQEETAIGTQQYNNLAVHLNHLVAAVTTGLKNGDDFREIVFQDLDHTVERGLYYQFADNYWITTYTSEYKLVSKDIVVRRCNNFLKWQDPDTGAIISYPCALDYEASSPKDQVAKNIITPNNHVVIIVQGNDDTRGLKVNQRLMFNGRPFKMAGYNNYMQNMASNGAPTLLYFDAYLDEIADNDNITTNIANDGQYNYEIKLSDSAIEQVQGYTTQLQATVLLNGAIVTRTLTWASSDTTKVTVTSAGVITIVGDSGTANITATLGDTTATVAVTIITQVLGQKEILINPVLSGVKQGETISFVANVYEDGVITADVVNATPSGVATTKYSLTRTTGNTFALECIKPSDTKLTILLSSGDITKTIQVALEPLF